MKCCGESSYASVKPEPSEPPQHKNVRNMSSEMLRATFQKMSGFPIRTRGPVSRRTHIWAPEVVSNFA